MDVTVTERNVVLVAHILAAIVFLGPVTIATSLFPRYVRLEEWPVAKALHRISRGYGMATLAVPAFGMFLAARLDSFGALWISLSLGLFVVAFVLLVGVIVPLQRRLLMQHGGPREAIASQLGKLHATAGVFGVIWVVILYLMVAKPS